MLTAVRIDLRYFDAHYFDDPGLAPATPPTGYSLKPEVEQWLRSNGGCDGWRPVDAQPGLGTSDLVLEISFSVEQTATLFRGTFC